MSTDPTPRQLDALAAWWQSGGSNITAAKVMGITPQVMRNTLMAFRRQEKAASNVALMQRYWPVIQKRKVRPSARQKAA